MCSCGRCCNNSFMPQRIEQSRRVRQLPNRGRMADSTRKVRAGLSLRGQPGGERPTGHHVTNLSPALSVMRIGSAWTCAWRPMGQYGYGMGPQGTSISVGALMPNASLRVTSSSSAVCARAPRAP